MESFRQAPPSLPATVLLTIDCSTVDYGRIHCSTFEPFRGRYLGQLIDEGWFIQLLGPNGQVVVRRMG
jgi:hypothetical protein